MKKILLCTTIRDRGFRTFTDEQFFNRYPSASGHLFGSLKPLGWETLRLGFSDTINPFKIAKAMTSYQPDLVYAYGATGEMPYWARKLSGWRGPIVHSWDDYYDEIWKASFGRIAGYFMRHYEMRIIRHSDHVITLSKYLMQKATVAGVKAWFVPNGCDPFPPPRPTRISLEGRFKLAYCGGVNRYKRVQHIVTAMKHLPPDFRLYLTGPVDDTIRRAAPENVVFFGNIDRNDVWHVMRQADVLVNTSDQDCSVKFRQYVRMGKPILSCGGRPAMFFTNGRNAVISDDFVNAIWLMYNNPELRKQLADNVVRDIPVLTYPDVAKELDRVLTDILAESAI